MRTVRQMRTVRRTPNCPRYRTFSTPGRDENGVRLKPMETGRRRGSANDRAGRSNAMSKRGASTDDEAIPREGDMREMGVRGLPIYCADYRCATPSRSAAM